MSDSDKSTDERKVDEFDSHDIRRSEDAASVGRLLEIMARLRDPDTGCPWDIEQTFQTIAPYTIEEAYEVADAIQQGDMSGLKGELGDLMLQVVYHSQMASELGHFTFADVVRSVCDKMVSRHPHVFGNESRDKTADEQTRDWENVKAAERASSGTGRKSVLAGIARNLPALVRAKKLQDRAARVGFDWPDATHVLEKLSEEASELIEVRETPARAEDEFGDLLFSMIGLARHLGIDAETALRSANSKFTRRFEAVESAMAAAGRSMDDASLEELDAAWDTVKSKEDAPSS